MKVKKPQPMETTETKTPAPVLNKTSFKNKTKKEKKPAAGKGGTLTSQLLDAAASTLASATPAERAERLAKAKARRAKKRNKNKAASGAAATTPEKKKKTKQEAKKAEDETPAVPLSQEMKAKIEERKKKKMEKRKRQKEQKLAMGVKEANIKKLKAKKGPLAAKIEALQDKFSKQREKVQAWKLAKKTKSKGAGNAGEVKNVAMTKEEKNKKRNLKKKQRLARRKAEGVAVFKPRKGRKGKEEKAEAMME